MNKPGKALAPPLLILWICVACASCSLPPRSASPAKESGTSPTRVISGDVPPEEQVLHGKSPDLRERRELPELNAPLSVEEALRYALVHHPELAASQARVEAAIGRRIEAGALPNPIFSATMESAPFSGKTTGNAEYPIGVVQPIPMGGRLGKAARVAEARERQLVAELQGQRREVARRVRGAFAAALFASEHLEVERELLEGAEQAAQIATERFAAGDVSADDQARAELEAARARISLKRAEVARRRAHLELQGALGQREVSVPELSGELEATLSLPELAVVLARLEESPVLRAQAAAVEASEAEILREEANRIPDIDVGFFYRRIEETSDNAFDVSISMPLPVFSQREGAIRRARADALEARAQYRKASMGLANAVQTVYWKLADAIETARLFREELLTRSETVLRAAHERYGAGEISLAELIPIRRDHRELRLTYLALLRQVAEDWAEFRSLIEDER